MHDDGLLILKGDEVRSLLDHQEAGIMRTVAAAYIAHSEGQSSLPHSTFLRFPGDSKNRIIALPAYLGKDFGVAGVKWVSSFPDNPKTGMDRASAAVIVNSTLTGRPEAFLEGSIISAKRTAASAALAAKNLRVEASSSGGIVGCGLINFEILRFLLAACPEVSHLVLFDLDPERAKHFKNKCSDAFKEIDVEIVDEIKTVFRKASLISMATTAIQPHIHDVSECAPGSVILHISLRDFSPEVILACDNVVDDPDHVCRAETSVHLAEKQVGNRNFINCTLADVLVGDAKERSADRVTIFSPFGLGVLDLALAKFTCELAAEKNCGTRIDAFMPTPWTSLNQ